MESPVGTKLQIAACEIRSDIESIAKNPALNEETVFLGRSEAMDHLEIHLLDRIDGLLQAMDPTDDLIRLKLQAESMKGRLEAIDEKMFRRIRAEVRAGRCRGKVLKDLILQYVGLDSSGGHQGHGDRYDALDAFVNGLLFARPAPVETKAREAETVYYQKTPARIVFELVSA